MLYTLIIVTALIPTYDYRSGGNLSTYSVPGFSSEAACLDAAKRVQIPADGSYHKTKAIFTCVPID